MNKLVDFRQFWLLTMMHYKELIREPSVLFWGIIFPVLMSLGLGIAFTKTTDTQRNIAVVDTNNRKDCSSAFYTIHKRIASKELAEHQQIFSYTFDNKKLGKTVFLFQNMLWTEALSQLKRGKINVIITLEHGSCRYFFDPANLDAQNSYMKLSQVFATAQSLQMKHDEDVSTLNVPGTRYIDFLIPGLTAMGIMTSIMWGLSYGVIEKRSNKLLRRMIATPMKKSYFLLTLFVVRIVMNLIESIILVLFAMLAFHISIQGSIVGLFAVFIAGNIAFAGLAIFVSARTSKTEIGNGLINIVVMPMMLLSGIFFSYHNFPDVVVSFIKYLPLTMLADSMRSVFIEGAGIIQVAVPILILSTMGLCFFIAGLKLFKWY